MLRAGTQRSAISRRTDAPAQDGAGLGRLVQPVRHWHAGQLGPGITRRRRHPGIVPHLSSAGTSV